MGKRDKGGVRRKWPGKEWKGKGKDERSRETKLWGRVGLLHAEIEKNGHLGAWGNL